MALDARGKPYGAEEPAARRAPARTPAGEMDPAQYVDRYFRTMARRINFIRRHATRHFEAAKFCLELEALLARRTGSPQRV